MWDSPFQNIPPTRPAGVSEWTQFRLCESAISRSHDACSERSWVFYNTHNVGLIFTGHQQKLRALLSASFFSMISPARYGRLVAFHFHEVTAQLPEVPHFWALPPTSITSRTLEVIEMFPDEDYFESENPWEDTVAYF